MILNDKEPALWISRTAVFIALIIVLQAATASLGNPIITGSIVNLMLIIAVMTSGLLSGLSVAAISPVAAKVMGIGPLWSILPFIVAGNAVFALSWYFIGNRNIGGKRYFAYITALMVAAAAKFFVLYIGIVQIAVPMFLNLPEQQAAVISNMFSVSQLITALLGGALAVVLFPRLRRAISREQG